MATELPKRRKTIDGRETRLQEVRVGRLRLFDFDAENLIVHIKPVGHSQVIIVDLKAYLSRDGENLGG